ncbi:acyl-CoA thioesterase II [Streptacidiphilus sp. PB12-B1b]|uniref:acyl-CoA thioesterase n=1 Tax=Streptacidiphilus sp. PB12-B1b TaxID=2705012 RepID=UPI0015FBB99C|nr:acyl-CoA thioesterase domain-containing protein [Streptacidiphilus sp. PB12-B1b]QMU76218.1 acyl-CoA thioesterase II [Streptacidiphilus sp. PB12-B1b]
MVDATGVTDQQPSTISSFVDLLRLDDIDLNLFRGWCHAGAPLRAFGGQVAAQALVAAGRTVPAGRLVHSLHGYFMRPGDPRRPLVYEVERLRDGRSYATRRVTAIQRGEAVFTLSASFKVPEESPERQRAVPLLPDPELLPDPYADWADDGTGGYWATTGRLTLDMRTVPSGSTSLPGRQTGVEEQYVWLKSASPLPGDDPLMHVCALAYLSDLTLASTAAMHLQRPRAERRGPSRISLASLDHAMWFHRPFRADEWLLFAQRSPSAGDGRGLAQGEFYTRDGRLVASVVQEALVRELHQGASGGSSS